MEPGIKVDTYCLILFERRSDKLEQIWLFSKIKNVYCRWRDHCSSGVGFVKDLSVYVN